MTTNSVINEATPHLISPAELAAALGVPLATIYTWRSRGYGPPAVKVGKHLRWRREDVEAWLEERRDLDRQRERGSP